METAAKPALTCSDHHESIVSRQNLPLTACFCPVATKKQSINSSVPPVPHVSSPALNIFFSFSLLVHLSLQNDQIQLAD